MTVSAPGASASAAMGPLTVSAANPRYLARPDGTPVYLSGSHTWAVLQDGGPEWPPAPLDWERFLATIVEYGHTFVRLWTWEHPRWASWWEGDYTTSIRFPGNGRAPAPRRTVARGSTSRALAGRGSSACATASPPRWTPAST